MDPLVGVPVVAALTGIPHCLGMCGPFACAAGGRPTHLVAWHVGRVGTYTSLGALAGAVGASVPGPPWVSAALGTVLLVGFAASLAGIVPEPHLRWPALARLGGALARRSDLGSRVLFGAVNGLLPCGLVWTALAVPVALAHPVQGAFAMALFGAATVPALTAWTWGARRLVGRGVFGRRALAVLVLATGLWSVGVRAGVGAESPSANGEPPCHATP